MGRTACTEPQCLYKGCTLPLLYSRAIPLLPLGAVRPVQSLSTCTRGALYLTVELYLYSPYRPYGLYRASVPVQGGTLPYSRAIPLLPYRPYGLYRASVPVQGCTLPLYSCPCARHEGIWGGRDPLIFKLIEDSS